jgi:hypothetical protein
MISEDKNTAAHQIALLALLELPERIASESLEIEILNQPELLRKLEVINWTPGIEFKLRFYEIEIDALITQVTV